MSTSTEAPMVRVEKLAASIVAALDGRTNEERRDEARQIAREIRWLAYVENSRSAREEGTR